MRQIFVKVRIRRRSNDFSFAGTRNRKITNQVTMHNCNQELTASKSSGGCILTVSNIRNQDKATKESKKEFPFSKQVDTTHGTIVMMHTLGFSQM